MRIRNRSRLITVPGGTYRAMMAWNNPKWIFTRRSAATVYREDMMDYVGKKRDIYGLLPESTLYHRRTWHAGQPVTTNGSRMTSTRPHWHAMRATALRRLEHLDPPPIHTAKDRGDLFYLTRLLERTNPYRPEYSVFVQIREMVELLSLFQLKAKTLLGLAGSAYLNYRFGMLTLVRDLKAATQITESIASRLKELRSIQMNGGLRRSRVPLDTYSTKLYSPNWILESSPAPVRIDSTDNREYVTKVTGSLRWFPAPGAWKVLENLTPLEEFNMAVRLVLDLEDPGLASAWEIIPFSWLIDYFYEIGSYLEATRGFSVVEPHYITVTRRTHARRYGVIHRREPSDLRIAGQPDWNTKITLRTPLNTMGVSLPTGFSLISQSEAKVILALLSNMKR